MVGAVVATSYVLMRPHPVLSQGIALLTLRLSPENRSWPLEYAAPTFLWIPQSHSSELMHTLEYTLPRMMYRPPQCIDLLAQGHDRLHMGWA